MGKIITIPPPVKVPIPRIVKGVVVEEEVEKTIVEYIREACDGHDPFRQGPKNARQYMKIMDTLEKLNGDSAIRFEDADYDAVKEACLNAQWLTPKINAAYQVFWDAIEKAQDVKFGATDKLA